jgi:hypothetical protein
VATVNSRFIDSDGESVSHLPVVTPSQATGSIARYHVADQSNSRTRIELPTGAKAIRIFYSARKSTSSGAEARDAVGEALKVVFNIASTTEAGNALGESASSPGASITGVSYLIVPIDTSYEAGFPDEDDRLYYVDFLSVVAETGDSDVIVEVTL